MENNLLNIPAEAIDSSVAFMDNECVKSESLAFVMHSVGSSQCALNCIMAVNANVEKNGYNEICIFSILRELPIVTPSTAIYNTVELSTYYGLIVATDPNAAKACANSPTKHKLFYVYDINFVRNLTKEQIQEINNSGFRLFSRTKDHNNFLKKMGFSNVIDYTMAEPNVEFLYEIKRNIFSE